MTARGRDWPTRCTLSGCASPGLRPHHHHMSGGHLVTFACQCKHVDVRGTRPRVDPDGKPQR